jgi:putative intracellular protease/amidase
MRPIVLSLVVAALLQRAAASPVEETKPREGPRNVAIVVFPGVELLDFAGPGEVFASAWLDGKPAFHTYLVAESREPVMSMGFVSVTPQYTLDDCPVPDIVVVPGGNVPDTSEAMRKWVRARAQTAELMMSVCNGALVYGAAGLLEGLEATTHKSTLQSLALLDPKITVHTNRRFVDTGRVMTTAGISAGIDGALHVVQRMCGEKMAWKVARNMEYDWRPDEIANLHAEPGRPVEGIEALQLVTKTHKIGLEAALAEYRKLEKPPSEYDMNRWGYTLLRAKRLDDAVGLMRFVEAAFPTSSNASDSLSEALEAAGDVEGAKKAAQTCLARLEKEHPLDPGQGQVVRNAASSRIARLSGAPASAFRYACAPCGGECDAHGYLENGRCPGCAMQLVEKDASAKAPEKTVKGTYAGSGG